MSDLDTDPEREWLNECEVLFARPPVRLADIGGLEGVKRQLRLVAIEPLVHPQVFKAYGKRIGGGILFYGPPGCGKTLLARALAGECSMNFTQLEIASVLDWEAGPIVRNLHAVFQDARRKTPSVVFVDEIDALLPSRGKVEGRDFSRFVNQFLTELDGLGSNNDGVLVIGSTNRPWDVDDAARRPGRFDRKIFVPPPDAEARRKILKIHLQGKPVAPEISLERLVAKTGRFSGADLRAIVDAAVEAAIEESLCGAGPKEGPGFAPRLLDEELLLRAARGIRPSTLEWIETARNYVTFANQGGYWDDIKEWVQREGV